MKTGRQTQPRPQRGRQGVRGEKQAESGEWKTCSWGVDGRAVLSVNRQRGERPGERTVELEEEGGGGVRRMKVMGEELKPPIPSGGDPSGPSVRVSLPLTSSPSLSAPDLPTSQRGSQQNTLQRGGRKQRVTRKAFLSCSCTTLPLENFLIDQMIKGCLTEQRVGLPLTLCVRHILG
ncbi:unnamed protein product [Pleuronectes platessa]|uniref:Uncharacterized protein n=1 Tax=Pleuronectes platessa TaxID=8262 RepID=A0A9N7TVR3_PLEPL|nr:unnamed protein product [Pleuronectes platessa]